MIRYMKAGKLRLLHSPFPLFPPPSRHLLLFLHYSSPPPILPSISNAPSSGEDSTDSSLRYAAYATRIRTLLLSAHRYVAYTSDIGESFRPVAHPYLIKSAYAISWLYLGGDVSHEGYKAYVRNQKAIASGLSVPGLEDWKSVAAQRAVFQSVASMGLPAFTIHSIVRYSGRALKDVKNVTLRTWGPIGLGLAVVPFLPYVFDKPVEEAVEWTFYNAFALVGGPQACGEHASTGRKEFFKEEFKREKEEMKAKIKDKEL
jgi:fission process protein 1